MITRLIHNLASANQRHGANATDDTRRRRSSWCLVLVAVLVLAIARESQGEPPTRIMTFHGSASALPGPLLPALLLPAPLLPASEQLDAVTVIAGSEAVMENAAPLAEEANRVVSAHVEAWIANLDSDAAMDGWKARLALFDGQDQLVNVRGHVTIRLSPNLIGRDGRAYRANDLTIQHWSKPLDFDSRGLMTVRLPASSSLTQAIDARRSSDRVGRRSRSINSFVPSSSLPMVATSPFVGVSTSDLYSPSWLSTAWQNRSNWSSRNRSVGNRGLGRAFGGGGGSLPPYGHLTVRVSVPGQGVFEAETDVRTRPSVKVFERDHVQP